MKWEEALQTLYDNKQTHDGFYTIKQVWEASQKDAEFTRENDL